MSRGYAANPTIAAVILPLSLLSYVVAALIAARFTFAFPSIAIGAPGASLHRSLAETRGSTWRLFFIFLFAFAPPFAVFIILYLVASVVFVINHPEFVSAPDRIVTAMMYSAPFLVIYATMFIIMMVMVAVTAAAAARAYEIRVDRGMTGVAEVFS